MQIVSGVLLPAGPNRKELVGLPALAAAVLRSGLTHDPEWFFQRPDVVELWCDAGGVEPDHFYHALQGYAARHWAD